MNDEFRYIAAIAEHGSISKAARAMHISQPGLSQRLKRLEDQLGTQLFDRTSTPLKPTAPGEVYLKYALRAIAAEDSMKREVYTVAKNRMRRLSIGVSMVRANALLSGPIVSFYETHQGCTIELREMSTLDQLHNLFLNNKIDFAVLTPISPDPAFYESEYLCHESLVVASAPGLNAPQLRQAQHGHIDLAHLEGLPLILPTCGDYYDPLIDHLIDSSGAQLDIVVRDCSTDLALSVVEQGLGVAIVPSTSLMGRKNLEALKLDNEAGNVLRYIRRSDKKAPPEERLFMSILKKEMGL